MSASINAEQFSRYFNNCPIVNCEGKMHDVTLQYLPPSYNKRSESNKDGSDAEGSDVDSDYDQSWETIIDGERSKNNADNGAAEDKRKKRSKGENMKSSDVMKILIDHIVDTIFNKILSPADCDAEKGEGGDILVFLPGQGEIYQCTDEINKRARDELNSNEGNRKFATKKVVCCTNIAETSLTIPGVTHVLDAGKAKKIQYDNTLRISALQMTDISQASAKQRKGRAGRVEPGHCYRLYSEEQHDEEMIPFDVPEMKQSPIDELYLYTMDIFKGLEEIELMEDAQPDKESIESAKKRLLNLEYINEDGNLKITAEGKFALSLGGDVSLEGAKMILAAKGYQNSYDGVVSDAIKMAVLLSQDRFYTKDATNEERAKYIHELGDHLTIFNLYKHFEMMTNQPGVGKARREERAREWCETLKLNYGTLWQMAKEFDRVYQNIKREDLCNIGTLVKGEMKKNNGNKKDSQRKQGKKVKNDKGDKPKTKLLEEYDRVENPTVLMKLVIAGYFHNICTFNDPMFMDAGCSLLTPINYGDMKAVPDISSSYGDAVSNFIFNNSSSNKDATLLKLTLSRDSNVKAIGDTVKDTAVIFRTLFKPPQGGGNVYMLTSSRIKPEWVAENASKRWMNSINLSIEDDGIKSFVETHSIPYIGIPVMCDIIKVQVKYLL